MFDHFVGLALNRLSNWLLYEFKIDFKKVNMKVTGTVSIKHINFNFDYTNLVDLIILVEFNHLFTNWNAFSLSANPFAVELLLAIDFWTSIIVFR